MPVVLNLMVHARAPKAKQSRKLFRLLISAETVISFKFDENERNNVKNDNDSNDYGSIYCSISSFNANDFIWSFEVAYPDLFLGLNSYYRVTEMKIKINWETQIEYICRKFQVLYLNSFRGSLNTFEYAVVSMTQLNHFVEANWPMPFSMQSG